MLIAVFAMATLFSVVALAGSTYMFAYDAAGQTRTSSAVTKNNNADAKAQSQSAGDHTALSSNGKISAYSTLQVGAGSSSGQMNFTGNGQTRSASYNTIKQGFAYVLKAKLERCDFTGRAMYQNFNWTP